PRPEGACIRARGLRARLGDYCLRMPRKWPEFATLFLGIRAGPARRARLGCDVVVGGVGEAGNASASHQRTHTADDVGSPGCRKPEALIRRRACVGPIFVLVAGWI